ncbi:hypothetical protein [Nonomuraea dietziae]|uniref:hypothetical protein n=1 Tax=Nonomuraea dietziae TaxID=65515 RepID=UPI0031D41CC6
MRELRGHGFKPAVIPATSLVTRAFARAGLNWEDALVVAPDGPGRLNNRVVNALPRPPTRSRSSSPPAYGTAEIARELAPTTPRALIVCEDPRRARRARHPQPHGEATTRPWKRPRRGAGHRPALPPRRGRRAAWSRGRVPGPDEWAVEGDLPPEVSAYVLAKLGPRLGDLVWDVGAGSGGIAVECARLGAPSSPSNATTTPVPGCAANVIRHGVKVALTRGQAPPALEPCPTPTRLRRRRGPRRDRRLRRPAFPPGWSAPSRPSSRCPPCSNG